MTLTFNRNGDLFVTDVGFTHDPISAPGGTIYTFKPSAKNPPIATIFASGVPGTVGIAFDKKGNLW